MRTTIDGVRIGYTDEGRGPAVVLVHGFPFQREVWRGQVDFLKSSHRVVAPDLRGFGESQAAPDAVAMDRFADDLHGLLIALRTGPAVLIGHSMGGYVALAFANRHPRMLSGLGLVATRAGKDTPEAAAARRATAEKVRAEGPQVVVEAMVPKMLSPANRDPAALAAVRGFMSPLTREGVIGALLGMAERRDATETLGRIGVPTLVVTGADDVLIPPAESERMARAIPRARLEILPGAGHLVSFEKGTEFNRLLADWLEVFSALP